MYFDDRRGTRFEIRVMGYENPESGDDTYDANWLSVRLDLRTTDGSFSATLPALLTWEVGWLALWLENLAKGVRQDDRQDFTEPNLSFRQVATQGDVSTLRISLSQEFAPPWATSEDGYSLEMDVPRSQLLDTAAYLRSDLASYPPRAGVGDQPPFVPTQLLPTFILDWELTTDAEDEDDAVALITSYAQWINLQPEIRSVGPAPREPYRWTVRFVTPLRAASRDYGEAVFQMLQHLPQPFGAPRVGGVTLWPDGSCECHGEIDPLLVADAEGKLHGSIRWQGDGQDDVPEWLDEDEEETEEEEDDQDAEDVDWYTAESEEPEEDDGMDFSQVRGWFALSNYEDEERFEFRHPSEEEEE